jgi:hypothetical protein
MRSVLRTVQLPLISLSVNFKDAEIFSLSSIGHSSSMALGGGGKGRGEGGGVLSKLQKGEVCKNQRF